MRQEVLRIEKLKKHINGISKLNGFDLAVYKGEIIGIAGLNGSGRSTLANILSGSIEFEQGEIFFDEQCIHIKSIHHAQVLGIFCIRFKHTLIGALGIIENMCLIKRGQGNGLLYPNKTHYKVAGNCLSELGISVDIGTKVDALTLAEKHMIEIGRAYYTGASMLILDDIGRDYSKVEYFKLEKLLNILRSKGVTVLLIESRHQHLIAVSDRIIVIKNGVDAANLYSNEFEMSRIHRIMVGREVHIEPNRRQLVGNVEKEKIFSAIDISTENLKNLNFFVRKGEVVGFVDKENMTCSDIVSLLCGDTDLLGGKVILHGEEITMTGGRKVMVNHGVGYIEYYKKNLFSKLSVMENITITGLDNFKRTIGINKRLNKFIVSEYAQSLGLTAADFKKPVNKVDNRTKMNIILYKWLISKAKLIVMDNVFSGTDVVLHNCIYEFFKVARKNNVGIIYTSPNVQEVMALCDRVYVLSNKTIEGVITDFE